MRYSFIIFIFTFLLAGFLSSCDSVTSTGKTEMINHIDSISLPSVLVLDEMQILLAEARTSINLWKHEQSGPKSRDKDVLKKSLLNNYPALKKELLKLSAKLESGEQQQAKILIGKIDSLWPKYSEIMNSLITFDDYEDDQKVFVTSDVLDEINEFQPPIEEMLRKLRASQNEKLLQDLRTLKQGTRINL
ncbi:MAG: hypothetical protein IAF38_15120 [Bacteroidia bacterium]|nr:hypothetical protein [Bacteroidia bacterium]